MTAPTAFRPRLASIGVFAAIYLVVAAFVGPTVVVALDIGIVEPTSAGWPFASVLFIVALIAGAAFAVAFATGMLMPSRHARYRVRRLAFGAVASAAVALVAPLLAMLGLALLGPLTRNVTLPPSLQQVLALTYALLLGLGLGRLTNRFS